MVSNKINPLLKLYANIDNQPVILLGGGGAITKRNTPIVNRNNPSITVKKKNTNTNIPMFKVNFVSDFADVFGFEIQNVAVAESSDTGSFYVTFEIKDYLNADGSHDTFDIKSIAINIKDFKINDEDINLDNDEHINYLSYLLLNEQTTSSIETTRKFDIEPVHVSDFEYLVRHRSFPNEADTQTFNNPGDLKKSKGAVAIPEIFHRETSFRLEANKYVSPSKGTIQNLYGPETYKYILLVDDRANKGESVESTRVAFLTGEKILHGIYDLEINRKDVSRNNSDIANVSSTLIYTWKSSSINIGSANITKLELRKQDGNVLIYDHDPSANITRSVVDGLPNFSYELPLSSVTNYEGPLYGYVQYNDIEWSPYNSVNANIIYDTSSVFANDEFTLEVERQDKSNISFNIHYYKHNTDVRHDITFTAYSHDTNLQIGNITKIYGVDNNNYDTYNFVIDDLDPGTQYKLKVEFDDRLNPVSDIYITQAYNQLDLRTLTDDEDGPNIIITNLVGQENGNVLFNINITDASGLKDVQLGILKQDYVFDGGNITENLMSFFETERSDIWGKPDSFESSFISEIRFQRYFYFNPQLQDKNFDMADDYTVVVYAEDISTPITNKSIYYANVSFTNPISVSDTVMTDDVQNLISDSTINISTTFNEDYYMFYGIFEKDVTRDEINTYLSKMIRRTSTQSGSFDNLGPFDRTIDERTIIDGNVYHEIVYTIPISYYIDRSLSNIYDYYTQFTSIEFRKNDKTPPRITYIDISFE